MNPFQPNNKQLESINNGASKLWFPIDTSVHYLNIRPSMFQSARSLDAKQFDIDCESESEFIKKYSPLQPNEQYFCMTNTHCIFNVTSVEVKYLYDLAYGDFTGLGLREWVKDIEVAEWYDSQYPDQSYSSNPVGFLVTIERI